MKFIISFLFYSLISCHQITKILESGKSVIFFEQLGTDDLYINFSAGLISLGEDVFIKILTPEGNKNKKIVNSESISFTLEESDDVEENVLTRNYTKKFENQGLYVIQIYNRGKEDIKFSISSQPVKKLYKSNEDVTALRNILSSLQTSVGILGNENFYAKDIQAANMKELKRLNKILNYLFLYPISIVAFGLIKDYLARRLVRPTSKRFNGLF